MPCHARGLFFATKNTFDVLKKEQSWMGKRRLRRRSLKQRKQDILDGWDSGIGCSDLSDFNHLDNLSELSDDDDSFFE